MTKPNKLKYYIAQSWTIPWMWAARAKLELVKTSDYKTNQPYVVISNHLSNLDPMMQFKYLKIKKNSDLGFLQKELEKKLINGKQVFIILLKKLKYL